MHYQVKLSDEAARNYGEITAYLEERFGTSSKLKFQRRFLEFSILVADNPFLFQWYLKSKGIRRCVLSKEASAYYRVVDNVIQVITILDNRKKPPAF